MTTGELALFIGPLGFLLAVYGAIRTELLRRQGNNEEQRQELQQLKNDLEILKIRLAPLLEVMNKRLVSMFHEPHDRWRLDHVVEKYERDPESLTEEERSHLIRAIYAALQRAKPGGPGEDAGKALLSALTLALLDGERDVQRLQQYPPAVVVPAPEEIRWWKRVWSWLGGRKLPPSSP